MDNKKFTYKILISYDGTQYGGWQVQPNSVSIQEKIEEALFQITQSNIKVIGSGRTDAGVHANGQVAHFQVKTLLSIDKTIFSLNSLLPEDIRVLKMDLVPSTFHARFSAKSKKYSYYISTKPVLIPFYRQYTTLVPTDIDIPLMKEAAKSFLGTHDFKSFANQASKGSASVDSIRTIYSIDFMEEEERIKIIFHGNGFLYKMVRNIVGTLIDIGKGKMSIHQIKQILEAKDRRFAGSVAPAKGLFLENVYYGDINES